MNTSHNKRDPLKKALGPYYYKSRSWAMVIWTLKVTMILFIIRGLKHPRCTRYISSREPVHSKREGWCLIPSLHLLSYNYLPTQGSVQFSRSVVSDSLGPHESQHARPPCPSSTPGVQPDSRPSSQWCHPAISSSVVPFSSCPQYLPATEFFPVSQLLTWVGQSTGVSALASFPPKKSQGWRPSE